MGYCKLKQLIWKELPLGDFIIDLAQNFRVSLDLHGGSDADGSSRRSSFSPSKQQRVDIFGREETADTTSDFTTTEEELLEFHKKVRDSHYRHKLFGPGSYGEKIRLITSKTHSCVVVPGGLKEGDLLFKQGDNFSYSGKQKKMCCSLCSRQVCTVCSLCGVPLCTVRSKDNHPACVETWHNPNTDLDAIYKSNHPKSSSKKGEKDDEEEHEDISTDKEDDDLLQDQNGDDLLDEDEDE